MMTNSYLVFAAMVLLSSALIPDCRAAVDGEIDPSDLDLDSSAAAATTFDLDDDSAAAAGDVSDLGRAAGFGHSTIAAGKQPPIDILGGGGKFVPPPPPFLTKPVTKPIQVPIGAAPGDVSPFAGQNPVIDPLTGLTFLEYIQFLLERYPNCKGSAATCDFTRYTKCTCMSPAVYTLDGRGNCNLGVTKPDKQVWCYVNDKFGHPLKVCPDSRESTSRPGLYWSRFACITE